MKKFQKEIFTSFLAYFALSMFSTVYANPGRPEEEVTGANYLGGHRFTPSFFILTPFAVPSLTTGTNVAIAHPSYPGISENLDVAGIALSVEAQIPIIKHLVLGLRASGLGAAGINAVSALNYGASTGTRLQVGALYQLIESSKIALTAGLSVGKPKLYTVSPLVSAKDYFNNLFQGNSSDLNFATESTQWYPSVRFAYAFNPTFGLQSSAGVQFFSSTDEQGSRSQFTFGLGFDAQLKPELNIPIALGVNYVRNQLLTRAGAQDTNTYAFSVFETFSERFNFGTEFGWITVPGSTAFTLGLMARYYY